MESPATHFVVRINVPSLKMQKMLRVSGSDLIWNFKLLIMEKTGLKDAFNFGFLYQSMNAFKFLDESKSFAASGISTDV